MNLLKKILLVVIVFSFYLSVQADIAISPLKYEITIERGNIDSKIIKVTNDEDEAITLYTSTEDFIAGKGGTPTFIKLEDQTYPELSLANWIELEDKNITLAPGETREIKFSIKVPKNGEPGGHYGAIFFSPGVPSGVQVAIVQRIGVLILIDVPGEVKIDGTLSSFKIGENDKGFIEKDNFNKFPISFETIFENKGNIHIKPIGKIELIDENGNVLEKVGKESIPSPNGAFIGERMVNYIPINDAEGNILPNSSRIFDSIWEGFGYTVLQDDGTKVVKFKNLTEFYAEKAAEKQAYLMFWEQVHTRTVNKKITAKFSLSFKSKDLNKKDFNQTKDFYVTYEEKFIGVNYYIITIVGVTILLIILYIIILAPKIKSKKEEELRKKIIQEMKNNK